LLAAFFGLAGCANDVLSLFKLDPYKINSLVFFGPYCLLIGYLIFKSTFLPRILGVRLADAMAPRDGCGRPTLEGAGRRGRSKPRNRIPAPRVRVSMRTTAAALLLLGAALSIRAQTPTVIRVESRLVEVGVSVASTHYHPGTHRGMHLVGPS
jgi:hypothetical protein